MNSSSAFLVHETRSQRLGFDTGSPLHRIRSTGARALVDSSLGVPVDRIGNRFGLKSLVLDPESARRPGEPEELHRRYDEQHGGDSDQAIAG